MAIVVGVLCGYDTLVGGGLHKRWYYLRFR